MDLRIREKMNHIKNIVLWIILFISFWLNIFCHNPLFANDLKIEFTIPEKNIQLTESEKKWIKNNPKITIAGPRNFPPFHYYDQKGLLRGLSADYIVSILFSLGIEPLIEQNILWSDVLKKAQEGKIDLIPCIAKTQKRESYLLFSHPYLTFPIIIITRKDSAFIGGIEDLNSKTLAFVRNIYTIDYLKQSNIDFIPYYVNTPFESLEAVSFGKADATIQNLAAATYYIENYGLTNLKVTAPTPIKDYSLHMAVRHDLHPLNQIINKAIVAINPKQRSHIRNKWLSVRYEYGINMTEVVLWVSGIILFFGMSILIFYAWNRKLKIEISERKRAENKLLSANQELSEKNTTISQSIQYAEKIQSAMLPDIQLLKTKFDDVFVIFKPKDIVSGDFYWYHHIENKTILACADCTGHGVPGGLLSMLGISFLNQLVSNQMILAPSQLLEEMRNEIKTSLHQTGQRGEQKDGMDVSICLFDHHKNILEFAGANNGIFIIHDHELRELKPTRNPIGIYRREVPFKAKTIQLTKGDFIYCCTDGFFDQFGGMNRKQFKKSRLKQELLRLHSLTMDEQKKQLESILVDFMKGHDQIDDITLIGIKI
jgi:serine phosphatase RsbU (regulator of sigma subunit)/ABC-type amino acid transport substrate-binding protein